MDEFNPRSAEPSGDLPVCHRFLNQLKEDGSVGDFYFVRASAIRALQKIENHERPPIDRGLPPSEYEPVK